MFFCFVFQLVFFLVVLKRSQKDKDTIRLVGSSNFEIPADR